MGVFKTIFTFLFGAAVGGSLTWYLMKDTYEKRFEEDFLSEKEAFLSREDKLKATIETLEAQLNPESSPKTHPTVLNNSKIAPKVGVTDYATAKYQQYAQKVKTPVTESDDATVETDVPYVIPPDEFGETEYTQVSLTYFADGVLTDDQYIVVENIEEIVGDALDHFGEYEEDSVFCRNNRLKCDYEILMDLRKYKDIRKTLPRNI